jgi:hypothetical protein
VGVPSSMVGLVLFVVLLWPGFAYTAVRARRLPERQFSVLRETVSIVATSLTAIAVVGALFAGVRVFWPGSTPDLGRLLFDTRAYVRTHHVSVGWWGFGLLVLAVIGSAGVAAAQSSERLGRVSWLRWLVFSPDRSSMSSWWLAFTEWSPDEVDIHLGCTLDDGSYVRGRLFSYSQLAEDVADRDLTLVAPIEVRPKGGDKVETVDRAGLMIISARHLVTMTVTYVPKTPATPAPATTPPQTQTTPPRAATAQTGPPATPPTSGP